MSNLELHLDLVGGLAGDMFIAALLDAFPQYEEQVIRNIQLLAGDVPLSCAVSEHRDAVLQGRQFSVRAQVDARHSSIVPPRETHTHTCWALLRQRLTDSSLPPNVIHRAIAIFQILAEAEGFVHGVAADAVEFHEVGAWDSIADIVGAATLIDVLDAASWTVSAIPLGTGRVRTEHGIMPVPAPATTRLLLGMPTIDDGIAGERVTPTGAAILRYVCRVSSGAVSTRARRVSASTRTLIASGTGFGTRTLPGISNHVRVLCFDASLPRAGGHRHIHVLDFEIDDQTGEDLAAGVDRLRIHEGVLDVVQSPVYGKKGRMMAKIQVLVRDAHLHEVIDACFRETTTIGLRHHRVAGVGLERRIENVMVRGEQFRVKVVDRPGGITAKGEAEDVRNRGDMGVRTSLRVSAESAALARESEESHAR